MLEKTMEIKLKTSLNLMGAIYLKFTSPSTSGVPDRIVIWPNGRVHFLELKQLNGKLSKVQKYVTKKMKANGATVYVLKGWQDCFNYLEEFKTYGREAMISKTMKNLI